MCVSSVDQGCQTAERSHRVGGADANTPKERKNKNKKTPQETGPKSQWADLVTDAV
jgi:hypothetical protein